MSYDLEARADAIEVLATVADGGYGKAMVFTAFGAGTRDPETLKVTPSTASQTGSGIEMTFKAKEIDGTLIKATDRLLVVSPVTSAGADLTEPKPGGTVAYGGKTVTIMGVERKQPADEVILFRLHVRGGA